jgi:PTS system ascorbate-specific IIA component
MPVGLLIVTHRGLGAALIEAARAVVGPLPLAAAAVDVGGGDDATEAMHRAARAMRELDQGDGVLVLTDLYGATPSNIAARIAEQGTRVRRVAGVNLPMLLRVLNYAEQSLDELVLTAASGARNGVIVDQA